MDSAWHDDQYLFRLTSTFGWEEAIIFCEELVAGMDRAAAERNREEHCVLSGSPSNFNDSLHASGRSNKFKSLDDWLEHARNQLLYQDQWGNTPLHAASYVQPPVDVINALFDVGRSIWKYTTVKHYELPIWAVPSKDNSTPFLVACSTGTDFIGLRRYLDEIEYYIDQNWVSSHARMLVLHPDNQGVTPLRGWNSFHNGYIFRMQAQRSIGSDVLADYADFVTHILWYATSNTYPEYPSTKEMLLIRCTHIARQFPEPLLTLLLGDENHDVVAMARDERNRLPLHNAIDAVEIESKSFNDLILVAETHDGVNESSSQHCNRSHQRNRNFMIQDLLHWYPKSAKENFPGGNNQSTLCRAITLGDQWHINNTDHGVVQLLCEEAPEKLEEKDSLTGLYPFMLAATIQPSTSNDVSETSVVETIYHVLRQYPQPIFDCLR